MSILNKKALTFLENYLNNAAPTGYESNGQKIWMDYLIPYVVTYMGVISLSTRLFPYFFAPFSLSLDTFFFETLTKAGLNSLSPSI